MGCEGFAAAPNASDLARISTPDTRTIASTTPDQVIANERAFKMEVYDWLTNGQPKIFRSATEGTFIVRLTNVSLAPEDRLGRRLHTFTATATEVAQYSDTSLLSLGLIDRG